MPKESVLSGKGSIVKSKKPLQKGLFAPIHHCFQHKLIQYKILGSLGGANNDDATDADADDGVESRGLGSRSADNPPEAKATVDTNHDSDLDRFGSSRNLLETGKEKGDSQNGSKDRVKQKGMDSKGTHQPSCLPLPCFRRQTRRKRYHSPSSDESSEDSRRWQYSALSFVLLHFFFLLLTIDFALAGSLIQGIGHRHHIQEGPKKGKFSILLEEFRGH
ncbi:hypothetical protein F2Q70_00013908 [Brassica cretica]|uniref:Uncharacterized protein n=1 Tax=Brassica cretica TaxID=69181 RepID=A0A8S9LZL5_BRACR|nr:hypothetical protein F2Q70_00013908 [Brassica cretica]